MTSLKTVLTACTVAFLASSLHAQSGPPGDGEIRTTRDPATGDTVTSLTLMLRGPQGSLPINMTFLKTRKAGAPGGNPEIRIDFDFRMFAGQPDNRAPHLKLTLDAGTKNERSEEHNVDPKMPLQVVKLVSIPFSSSTLSSLTGAGTIRGTILGVDFVLAPNQIRAIKEFAGSK